MDTTLKIRIGYGLGPLAARLDRQLLGHIVDTLEALRFDSLWVSERVNNETLDPMVVMTFAIARTERLKVGPAVMVVPGRNPVLLAKSLASLDHLSGGRVLPAFGLGIANTAEHQAFGVEKRERSAWFEEALPLLRRLWSGESITHRGERFQLDDVRVLPTPAQDPFEVWMGGASEPELRRAGRLSDGWLPSFSPPAAVESGIAIVNQAAADAGREIDDEHFGVLIPYLHGEVPEQLNTLVRTRHPDAALDDIVARSPADLVRLIGDHVSIGASKFVVFGLDAPSDWDHHLGELAETALPLQN
ncbi:MAG: LLM class flavin-dependent oxidoreductase [Acidobacteria bacterium]|nr:LLM class flavin-dependent oxidoreductase [Acidobacteriota bacterium]